MKLDINEQTFEINLADFKKRNNEGLNTIVNRISKDIKTKYTGVISLSKLNTIIHPQVVDHVLKQNKQ